MPKSESISLQPKNWDQFQHYKNRKPPWIKLHHRLLDDYQFACLPLASQALAPRIWLLASEYMDGKITATLDEIAFRFHISKNTLIQALIPLVSFGFLIDASNSLARCKQDAMLETETETETETEAEEINSCPILEKKTAKRKKVNKPDEVFLAWYEVYPRHEARGQALQAWKRALSKTSLENLMAGVRRYAEACKQKEARFIRYPATWLNGEGWLDEEKPNETTDRTMGPGIGYITGPKIDISKLDGHGNYIPDMGGPQPAEEDRPGRPLEPAIGRGQGEAHGLRVRAQSDPGKPLGHERGHGRTVEKLGDDRSGDRALSEQIQTSHKPNGTLDRTDGSRQSGGESPPGPARPTVERKRLIAVTPEDRARLMAAELIEPPAQMAPQKLSVALPAPVEPSSGTQVAQDS